MSDPPIIIRPVSSGDFDQWAPLWAGYNAFYGRELISVKARYYG